MRDTLDYSGRGFQGLNSHNQLKVKVIATPAELPRTNDQKKKTADNTMFYVKSEGKAYIFLNQSEQLKELGITSSSGSTGLTITTVSSDSQLPHPGVEGFYFTTSESHFYIYTNSAYILLNGQTGGAIKEIHAVQDDAHLPPHDQAVNEDMYYAIAENKLYIVVNHSYILLNQRWYNPIAIVNVEPANLNDVNPVEQTEYYFKNTNNVYLYVNGTFKKLNNDAPRNRIIKVTNEADKPAAANGVDGAIYHVTSNDAVYLLSNAKYIQISSIGGSSVVTNIVTAESDLPANGTNNQFYLVTNTNHLYMYVNSDYKLINASGGSGAGIQVVNGFNNIPNSGNVGDMLYLNDGYRSGLFIKKSNLNNDGGINKNNWKRVDAEKTKSVNILWFGADPTGGDTFDWSYVLNNYTDIYIPHGKYQVPHLTSHTSSAPAGTIFNIHGDRATIVSDLTEAPDTTNEGENIFLQSSKRLHISGLIFDGENYMPRGLELNGDDCIIEDCEFKNYYAIKIAPIMVYAQGENTTIRNCLFHDATTDMSNDGANNPGVTRAIISGAFDTVEKLLPNVIENCKFWNIWGKNGDCIQNESGDVNDDQLHIRKHTIIKGCEFWNFGKRAIKFSCSMGRAYNNTIRMRRSDQTDPNLITNESLRGFTLQGNDHIADGNHIDVEGDAFEMGIERHSDGSLNDVPYNHMVTNNDIKTWGENNIGIDILNVDKFKISGNKFEMFGDSNHHPYAAMRIVSGNRGILENNLITDGSSSSIGIELKLDDIYSTNNTVGTSNIVISNNSFINHNLASIVTCEHSDNVSIQSNTSILKSGGSKYMGFVDIDATSCSNFYITGNSVNPNGNTTVGYATQNVPGSIVYGNSWESLVPSPRNYFRMITKVDITVPADANDEDSRKIKFTNDDANSAFTITANGTDVTANVDQSVHTANGYNKLKAGGANTNQYGYYNDIECFINGIKVGIYEHMYSTDGTYFTIDIQYMPNPPLDSANNKLLQYSIIEFLM